MEGVRAERVNDMGVPLRVSATRKHFAIGMSNAGQLI